MGLVFKIWLKIVGPASARSYKIGVVGNNWLVGNAVFSETAQRIFLIFCRKLGDYRGRKVTEPDFRKKFLIWRYSRKRVQISPKSDTFRLFWKATLTIFLVLGLELVLNMTFSLNETYFSEKIAIWRYLTSKLSKFSCFLPNRRSSQCIFVTFQNYFKRQLTSKCGNDLKTAVFNIKLVSSAKCFSFLCFKLLAFPYLTDFCRNLVFDSLLSFNIVIGTLKQKVKS